MLWEVRGYWGFVFYAVELAYKVTAIKVLLPWDKGTLEAKQKGWDEGCATEKLPHPNPLPGERGHKHARLND